MPSQQATKKQHASAPNGAETPVRLRLRESLLAEVDAWIERQPAPHLSRSDAVGFLIEKALHTSRKSSRKSPVERAAGRAYARKLAGEGIERAMRRKGETPPPEEKSARKRRLTTVPPELTGKPDRGGR